MDQVQRDRLIYDRARDYILSQDILGVSPSLLEKYLELPSTLDQIDTIPEIYKRLLISAQNANMRAGVIGGSIGGVERLALVLEDFDPTAVVAMYGDNWETLLDDIVTQLKPRGQIRRTTRSIWPQYCKTVLSSAAFMAQFDSAEDFFGWVDLFDKDDRSRVALPLLIEVEIYGLGFPLACDFLKEMGYLNFAKPDVHIRDIFTAIALCPPRASNFELFKAVIRVAHSCGKTPYNVDKLFWLIGSGYFYEDPQIGKNGRVGSMKSQFIAAIQQESS